MDGNKLVKVKALTTINLGSTGLGEQRVIGPGIVFEIERKEAEIFALEGVVQFVARKAQGEIKKELDKAVLANSPVIPKENHVESKDLPS